MKHISRFKRTLSSGLNEILILLILQKSPKPLYGYQIRKKINEVSRGKLRISHNVIYTILNKLERQGFVSSRWIEKEGITKRKYYILTDRGEKHLKRILKVWSNYARTIRYLRRLNILTIYRNENSHEKLI